MAKINKWNVKHLNCPINDNYSFSQSSVCILFQLLVEAFFLKHLVLEYLFAFEFTEIKLKTAYIIEAQQQLYGAP